MKLRNKKTGEIFEDTDILGLLASAEYDIPLYRSLAELNAEWEDYEEQKDHWHIGCEGDVFIDNTERYLKSYSSIGNDFESREEAEKAVEKLKAWKRMKDNVFEFDGVRLEGSNWLIKTKLKDNTDVTFNHSQQFYEDVDLLFGGEE